uniref:Germin-like protein n=1 Tax=Opuntia streptacantha TaxID=393608 RepID=A0A7C9AYN6_OPUST
MKMSINANMIACMAFAMALTLSVANAADPGPLQDFCVGVSDPHSALFVNGFFCKNPKDVTANDFLYRGFDTVGDTNNPLRSRAVMVNASTFPALNTLGITMARIDYEVGGVNPPHLHPRASEMLTVREGTLYAGFVTSNLQAGGNRLYAKVLNKGDIFVFPQGLIHFQLNIGSTPAVANAVFGSQTPGLVTVANAVFGSTPPIMDDVLTKGFQVDEKVIEALRAQFRSYDQPDLYSFI